MVFDGMGGATALTAIAFGVVFLVLAGSVSYTHLTLPTKRIV